MTPTEILQLREHFATEDQVAALRHVHRPGALTQQAISRILTMKSKPRTLASYVNKQVGVRLREDGAPT